MVTVDLIVLLDGGFLMLKRLNNPEKGGWWLPGGRIKKGETLEKAAIRKAKEELGMKVKVEKYVGVYELMFPKGQFDISNTHNVDFVFVLKTTEKWRGAPVKSSHRDYSDWKICKTIDKKWHPMLRRILKDAGFAKK